MLLNLTGVLLYELTELGGAEALFRAAIRLDPDLPHAAQNLEHALVRKRGTQARPRGAAGAMLRALGKRARAVAGRARPRTGMTLSLCMIVKDEEEMLPGLPGGRPRRRRRDDRGRHRLRATAPPRSRDRSAPG